MHNHLTRFAETNYFISRVNSLFGLKTLSYLSSKLWEELPKNLIDQSYLGAFQYGMR